MAFRYVTLLFALLLTAGCSTSHLLQPDDDLSGLAATGEAVVAIGFHAKVANSALGLDTTVENMPATIDFRDAASGSEVAFENTDDGDANLYRIPAGTYRLSGITYTPDYTPYHFIAPEEALSAPMFSVEAGEAVYLGSLDLFHDLGDISEWLFEDQLGVMHITISDDPAEFDLVSRRLADNPVIPAHIAANLRDRPVDDGQASVVGLKSIGNARGFTYIFLR